MQILPYKQAKKETCYMTQYLKGYELKDKAKDKLRGKYRLAITFFLFQMLLHQTVNLMFDGILSQMLPTIDVSKGFSAVTLLPRFIVTLLSTFIISSILGILNVGLILIYLKLSCGQTVVTSDLFYGYREDTGKALKISAVQVGANLILLRPAFFFTQCFAYTGEMKWIYIALIALVVGYAIYLPLALCLDLAFYFMLDFPEKTTSEILKISFRMMRGHKMRFFRLWISFFPIMLLGICTFYVGFLWIQPYMQMTYTEFYLDLMKPANSKDK